MPVGCSLIQSLWRLIRNTLHCEFSGNVQFEPLKGPREFLQYRRNDVKADRQGKTDPQRGLCAALVTLRLHLRGGGTVKGLAEQWLHFAAKICQMGQISFAPEQIAAELFLQFLDGPR